MENWFHLNLDLNITFNISNLRYINNWISVDYCKGIE
jgi:hypothetical protein